MSFKRDADAGQPAGAGRSRGNGGSFLVLLCTVTGLLNTLLLLLLLFRGQPPLSGVDEVEKAEAGAHRPHRPCDRLLPPPVAQCDLQRLLAPPPLARQQEPPPQTVLPEPLQQKTADPPGAETPYLDRSRGHRWQSHGPRAPGFRGACRQIGL